MDTISSGTAAQVQATAAPVGRPDVNRKRMARLGWAFSAPALIIVAAVTIFPIVYSVIMSLSNVTVTGSGINLNGFTTSNYSLVLKNSTWHYALGFTIVYTIITVLVELFLGTLIVLCNCVLKRLSVFRWNSCSSNDRELSSARWSSSPCRSFTYCWTWLYRRVCCSAPATWPLRRASSSKSDASPRSGANA